MGEAMGRPAVAVMKTAMQKKYFKNCCHSFEAASQLLCR